MEFGDAKEKIKVVWLCHFVNRDIQNYFGRNDMQEMSPWINILIKQFEENEYIDLNIVAPNLYTNSNETFVLNGITYHLFNFKPSKYRFFNKIWNKLGINDILDFPITQRNVSNVVRKINPHIVHLHGAENPYYSVGILPLLKKFPSIITIQGFIRESKENETFYLKKRIDIEERIIKGSKYFGVRTESMKKLILDLNPEAHFFYHKYPIQRPNIIKDNIGIDEPIDCIFFARICKDKGIEDLLQAIALIKDVKPEIKLSVIGSANHNYIKYLKKLCKEYNIEENVRFEGFLKSQYDIYSLAYKSKLCVLPTYHDIIPGTILESMMMNLPVIAYSVGGIPELNKDIEVVRLVEPFDIVLLSKTILDLLVNTDNRQELARKAYSYISDCYSEKKAYLDIVLLYEKIFSKNG